MRFLVGKKGGFCWRVEVELSIGRVESPLGSVLDFPGLKVHDLSLSHSFQLGNSKTQSEFPGTIFIMPPAQLERLATFHCSVERTGEHKRLSRQTACLSNACTSVPTISVRAGWPAAGIACVQGCVSGWLLWIPSPPAPHQPPGILPASYRPYLPLACIGPYRSRSRAFLVSHISHSWTHPLPIQHSSPFRPWFARGRRAQPPSSWASNNRTCTLRRDMTMISTVVSPPSPSTPRL